MRALVLGIALSSALAFASCTSESYSEAEGTETGPCFPNGTCNPGLVCASNRCVRIDSEGGATDGGGGATDATEPVDDAPNDAGDSGDGGGCPGPAEPLGRFCKTATVTFACDTGLRCCVTEGMCKNVDVQCVDDKHIECTSGDDCTDAEKCCLEGNVANPTTCPLLLGGFERARCNPSCTEGTELTLCTTKGAASCASGQSCTGASVTLAFPGGPPTSIPIGVCR